jgi:hypothetical protein
MTTKVTITTDAQSHFTVEVVKIDALVESPVGTLAPGETLDNWVHSGASLIIREKGTSS